MPEESERTHIFVTTKANVTAVTGNFRVFLYVLLLDTLFIINLNAWFINTGRKYT